MIDAGTPRPSPLPIAAARRASLFGGMKSRVDARRRKYARLITGRGLEIGALGNAMPLPFAREVLYSDLLTPEQVSAMYPGSLAPDIISDSERYPDVESETFDFVVANHVLEHLTDPLRALTEWHRILKRGGLLMLAVPDYRYTFDFRRERTTLHHLEEDHASLLPPAQLNECHLLEWAEHVEQLTPGTEAFATWVHEQRSRGYAVHNHVWVLQDILEIMAHLDETAGVRFTLLRCHNTSLLGNEFNLLFRKGAAVRQRDRCRPPIARATALAMHPVHEVASRLRRLIRHMTRRPARES